MVKLVLVLGVLAVGFVVVQQRAGTNTGVTATAPQVNTAGLPQEFRTLLARAPDPAALLRERGALPGLGVIRGLTGGDEPAPAPQPQPFADVGTQRELRRVRRDIRRDLAVLNRLATRDAATAERALAQVYSARVLERLGPDGRRAFAQRVAGHTQAAQRIKVLDFEGIFVSGRRALAQVVYRISTRSPSGRYVARSPAVWTVTLARENGRWRFVQGFE